MENIYCDDGVRAMSACEAQKACLLFFVDGQNETGKRITQNLNSLATFLKENKFVVLSTTHGSDLHHQFEEIHGHTATNTITFVANEGAAFLRWTGEGNLEDLIKNVSMMKNRFSADTGKFGYPSEVWFKELMAEHPSDEKKEQASGSEDVKVSAKCEAEQSVEKSKSDPGSVLSDSGKPVEKPQPGPSVGNVSSDIQSTKKPQAQPRDITVLQIRSPDGLSVTETFRTDCLLSEVREMIARHFSLTERFGIATSFPRYHYVRQDYNRSLEELNLWPNAALMIVPPAPEELNDNTTLRHYTGSIASWAYTIITYVWNRVRSIFSYNDREDSQNPTNSITRSHDGRARQPRRHGNVRTLRDTEKDDDKRRTTYNGNSTQQL